MEVAGYHGIVPFIEAGGGEFPQDGHIIPFNPAPLVPLPAYTAHPVCNAGDESDRHDGYHRPGQGIMEQEPENMVTDVPPVDLVAVTEIDPLPVEV